MQVLLQALLQVDPAQRPTAAAVCRDPWALDLPESPCDILDGPEWGTPYQHAMPQEEARHPRHDSEGEPAQEQHAVECTAQAMQHLWLQQEALMNGTGLFGGLQAGGWRLSRCCTARTGCVQDFGANDIHTIIRACTVLSGGVLLDLHGTWPSLRMEDPVS